MKSSYMPYSSSFDRTAAANKGFFPGLVLADLAFGPMPALEMPVGIDGPNMDQTARSQAGLSSGQARKEVVQQRVAITFLNPAKGRASSQPCKTGSRVQRT